MLTTLAQVGEKTTLMPQGGSTFAADVDWTFYFIYWVSVFFFVLIGVCMFAFAWKYRQKDKRTVAHGTTHNNTLEVTWSVIPLIIVMAIFMWGFRGFLDMTTPPSEAYEIVVDAKKWSWEFRYPEGAVSPVLHVPADTPVYLVLQSQDVIHSLFVPAFRLKMDAVPGRYNKAWFQAKWDADRAGTVPVRLPGTDQVEEFNNVLAYDLYCTEYCGTQHSMMVTSVVVHTPENFREWVANAADPLQGATPVDGGQKLYLSRGCAACHSADGSPGIGPTFRDLFGTEETLADGSTVTVDEAYIRESILNPGAQIVEGYQNVMPRVSLRDAEVSAMIAWMKSISESYRQNRTLDQINVEHGGEPGQTQDPGTTGGEGDLPAQERRTLDEARSIPSEDVPDQGIELQGEDQQP